MRENTDAPRAIQVRGARVHNLKNIDVDIPLDRIVGIAGVSGSGKSSLALGVLYAEGSRRYLESLSTYTRRRMTQAGRADVEEVRYVPAALALHQRPGVPGIRSTFGTGTELLNSLRLMFSRLASHRCPNGHYLEPSLAVAAGQALTCPVCGETFYAPSAEELSFNSQGACPVCSGTGVVRTVDRSTLVPDDSLTIDQGAVAPWNTLMWSLMTDVCRSMGVRTDVPFRELTDEEKHIVYDGPAVKKHILYHAKNSNDVAELDFTYFSAVYTVENALSKVKDEKGMKRVEKFLREDACSACGGTRLSEAARAPRLRGIGLDEACRMTLSDLAAWVEGVPASLPEDMRPMAESICEAFQGAAGRLMDLGLGYLTLDRAAATLSTGERQRMQLARAVRNRTTGVLYVLDEPSIGLHPANLRGLTAVMDDLVSDGNSVLLVDHDTQVLSHADYIVEMGPGAGADGGRVLAQGTVEELAEDPASRIGPFLRQDAPRPDRPRCPWGEIFDLGTIHLSTGAIHTVKPSGGGPPQGPADGGHGRLRLRQDHPGAGEPGPRPGGGDPEAAPARPRAGRVRPGHRAGEAHRRHAHRHQRALHGGDVCQCPRRAAEDLGTEPPGQSSGIQGRGLLLQHGKAPLPHLRRHRPDQPGRAVPSRCGHPLPRLPGQPVRPGRGAGAGGDPLRGGLHPAGAHGHGRALRAGRLRRLEAGPAAAGGAGPAGPWVSHPGGGHPHPLRRGGPAAQTGQRDGPGAGGHGIRL